jgi:BirA family biotin operon repressor/biotin-[acetyl-CoA-carboxylase] ligase
LVNLQAQLDNEMKAEILKALRESGDYVSGETLSKELSTSRVSVWKHIHSLEEDGYVLEASPRGYRLISSPDLLIPCEFPGLEQRIHYFREIGSTMDAARKLAEAGAEQGTIVVAESQSRGRGRLSKEWLSPEGGIYFTVILRPKISPAYAPRMSLMASVAVASAIRRLFGLRAELKWPNDVLIGGKKVCGILAEMNAELDAVNFINLGIGINANTSISQQEEKASSLKEQLGKEVSRKELFRAVLAELDERQGLLTTADLLEEWKGLSATIGRDVRILAPGEEITGKAVDIDSSGALMIRAKDGSLRSAIAGDCIHLG